MTLRSRVSNAIERECQAIRRDREHDQQEHVSLEEFLEYLDSYPSVFRRANNVRYSALRGLNRARGFINEIRWFIHRGRHGWSEGDLWNIDEYLVRVLLESITRARVEGRGLPLNPESGEFMTEEEWDDTLDEIIYGLRQLDLYHQHRYEMGLNDDIEANRLAHEAGCRSFDLIKRHLQDLSV